MKISPIFLFIVFLPFLISLGHDGYLLVTHTGLDKAADMITTEERPVQSFFASFGYIWTTYSPDTYKETIRSLSSDQWETLNALLPYKPTIIFAIFGAGLTLLVALLKALKILPSEGGAIGKKDAFGKQKSGKFKYKRK